MNLNRLSILSDAIIDVAKGENLRTSLQRLVQNAVEMTECTYGAIGSLSPDGSLEDFNYFGMSEETADEIPTFPQGEGLLGYMLKHPTPLRVSDIKEHHSSVGFPENHPAMRTFLGVPILVRGELYGSLYLTEKRNGQEFTDEDERLIIVLAAAAGVAIDNYRGHVARNQIGVLAERERIARDLHDLVIQRLFATGLLFQSITKDVEGFPKCQEIIQNGINDLDNTIQQIRATIFALKQNLPLKNVTTRVISETSSLSAVAGFEIESTFVGPLDDFVSLELADELIPVVRELVTNSIKHASATTITLSLTANPTYLELVITDNGIGYVEGSVKSGLLNLDKRAKSRGGEFEIFRDGSRGTKAIWRVSL